MRKMASKTLRTAPCLSSLVALSYSVSHPPRLRFFGGGELASIASHQHEIVWREELCDTFLPLELLNTLHLHPPTNVR